MIPALSVLMLATMACKRDGQTPNNGGGNGNGNGGGTSETTHQDLLIEEVYYFGNYHQGKAGNAEGPDGKWVPDERLKWLATENSGATHYNKYIKISNPTSKEMSLEGLGLALSTYYPNEPAGFPSSISKTIYTDSLSISKLYMFPKGDAKNILKPGESRLIATAAINPVESEKQDAEAWEQRDTDFSYLLDLTTADYELNPTNDQVPDLTPLYDYATISSETNSDIAPFDISRACGIALIRLGVSGDELIKAVEAVNPKDKKADKKGRFTRPVSHGSGHSISYSYINWGLFIPNDWVVDFVVVCGKTSAKWIINGKLDKSHNGINQSNEEIKNDDDWGKYAGMAIVRKHDGKKLVDSNDSKLDFEVKKASLYK